MVGVLLDHDTSEEGVFVPMKVNKLYTPKVGQKFNIFVFQIGRVSKKYKEIVRIRVDTTSWMIIPNGSKMGVWSLNVFMKFRICK